MKVAIYSRVSTKDKGQDVENQLLELREYCRNKNYTIYKEYSDNESGTKGRKERKAFDEMFKEASQKKFDLLLFWSLDRFSREGIRKTIHYLQHLEAYGVKFKSLKEEYLNTENELFSHICIAFLSYFAELESKRISERTKAGLKRAKAKGNRPGRPSKREKYEAKVKKLKQAGYSNAKISRELKLAINTVKKYLQTTVK